MPATPTPARDIGADVLDLVNQLGDEVRLVTDLLPADSTKRTAMLRTLNTAWLQGLIEFGQRKHCSRGVPKAESGREAPASRGQCLLLEDGYTWSGEKRTHHKKVADMLADELKRPEYSQYERYVPDDRPGADVGSYKLVPVTKVEAERELAIRVRLSDRGLASLRV